MSPLHQLHFEGLMLLFSERRDAVVKLLGSRPMEGLTHWQLVQRLSNDSTRLPVDKEVPGLGSLRIFNAAHVSLYYL